MKKRALAFALCAVMLLSGLPFVPFSSGTTITAAAADTASLQELIRTLPDKSRWSELYYDTTVLEQAYNNAMNILRSSDVSQANIDAAKANLSMAISNLKYHTTGVSLDKKSVNADVGDTLTLKATVVPANSADSVEWFSDNSTAASVSSNGVVTIKAFSGTPVHISAMSNGLAASCVINISNPLSGIALSQTAVQVYRGESFSLSATPFGADQDSPISEKIESTTWSSSDNSVATVSSTGVVTTKKEGSCRISVAVKTATKSAIAGCELTVGKLVLISKLTPVTISQGGKLTLTIGSIEDVKVSFEPSNASVKKLTWTSSDTSVATVSEGTLSETEFSTKIYGIKEGTAKITYAATDGSGVSGYFTVNVTPAVYFVAISPEKIVVTPDSKNEKITASVMPADAGNQVLKWETSNKGVCDVDYSGRLSPKMIGTCTITATTTDGSKLSGSCFVRVADPASSVALDKNSLNLNAGAAPTTLKATVKTITGMTYNDVEWISSNPQVATVDSEGRVSPIKPGTATIKAVALDGTGKNAVCPVTVRADLEDIRLSSSETVDVGSTVNLTPEFVPSFASNKSVKWSTDNGSIATVSSSGVVSGKSEGSCTIKCSSLDGKIVAFCTITVVNPISKITLSNENIIIDAGTTIRVYETVLPANATDKTVKWSSSNEAVARVSNGEITAVAGGNCVITCSSPNGKVRANCSVTVIESVLDVKFEHAKETLYVTQTMQLKPLIYPSTATNQAVDWKSSDTQVATVNSSGVVTAVKIGTAVITVTTRDGNYTAICTVNVVGKVSTTAISLEPKKFTVAAGETYGIDATVYPSNASNKEIKWVSNNESIASVSSDGLVTGVTPGTAVITATTVEGNNTDKCTVTVIQPVNGVSLSSMSIKVPAGGSKTLVAKTKPSNATNQKMSWYTSDETVAKVNEKGIVVGIRPGTATITVITDEGSFSEYCTVTVYTAQTGIKINSTKATVPKGGKTVLTATITPSEATDKSIIWSSSDDAIATVSETGLVQGHKVGSVTITARTADRKYTAKCLVEVVQLANSVTFDVSAIQLDVGKTKTIAATIKPISTTNKTVKWSSSNKAVATVNSKGVVTGVSSGTATITAVSADGNAKATCKVTVVQRVTSIKFVNKTESVKVGAKKALKIAILPENANESSFKWSSSNKKIAKVSSNGRVTGIKPGKVTITVKNQTETVSAKCTLNVVRGVEGVQLDKSALTVSVGKTALLKANILPKDAGDTTVTWTSSNNDVATVDSKGTISAKAVGYAEITAKTNDGGFTDVCKVNVVRSVKKVALNKKDATLSPDEKLTLTATLTPKNASNPQLKWTSSNKNIAKVSKKGVVTAIRTGKAVITVTTVDGGFTAKCEINVVRHPASVKLSKTSATIEKGGALKLKATVSPSDTTNKAVTWSSSNKKVATVDSNGNVKAIAKGTAVITAKTADGGLTAKCTVSVVVSPKSVTLSKTTATIDSGEKLTLKATVLPSEANGKVTWSSNNKAVAKVNSKGVVSAIKGGKATITAKAENGVKAACVVTVRQLVTDIELNKTKLTLNVSKKATLKATVSPSDAIEKEIEWISENSKIAKVNSKGVVTAVAPGTTTITAMNPYSSVEEVCTVTVRRPVASVKLDKASINLAMNQTSTLVATVLPKDASNKEVTWSTSNASTATVSSSGVVKAVGSGKATITVKTKDGGFKATCTVNVNVAVTGITLSPETKTMFVGAKEKLSCSVVPSNATNKKIIWSSSDTAVAKVSADGTIEPVANGTVEITAKTAEGGFAKTCVITVQTKASKVTLDKAQAYVHVGETVALKATVLPEASSNKGVTWSSSDETVAVVNAEGVVSARKLGAAKITVKTVDGGFVASCELSVVTPATGISLSSSSASVYTGEKINLTAKVMPEGAGNKNVAWSTSNKAIATVDSKGTVTAVGKGNAIITAKSEDGGFTASCSITVSQAITEFKFSGDIVYVVMGETKALNLQIFPENANDKTVKWSTSNETIAPIKDGVVTGKAVGEAKITVKANIGTATKTITVRVVKPANSVKIAQTETGRKVGDTLKLSAAVSPESATYKTVTWSSSDTKIATVDSNGNVKFLSAGTVKITAKSVCEKASDTITFTVKAK